MKKLLLAAFIFILAAFVWGSAKEKKREPDVKGGYRDCTVYHYDYKCSKSGIESIYISEIRKYNDNGCQIETIYYKNNGAIISREINKFDDFCYQIETLYYKKKGAKSGRDTFLYHDNGDLKIIKFKANDSIEYMLTYKYNGKGDLIEFAKFHNDGSYWWKRTYKYNESGNQIEHCYDGSALCSQENLKFDKNGKKIESVFLNGNTWCTKFSYKYDEFGNLIEDIEYDSFCKIGPLFKNTYIYTK